MGKTIGGNMKMTFKTKMRENKGSMLITIPKALVKLLEVKSGDSLNWEADITDKGVTVLVSPLKTEEKE